MKGLCIPGRVAEPASYGLRMPGAHYVLQVLVADDLSDKPYLAERDFGEGAAASIAAESAARHLRRGTPVVIHGHGLKDVRHRQSWVRRVIGCDLIEIPTQPTRTEAVPAADAA